MEFGQRILIFRNIDYHIGVNTKGTKKILRYDTIMWRRIMRVKAFSCVQLFVSSGSVTASSSWNYVHGLNTDQYLEEITLTLSVDCPLRTIFKCFRKFQIGNFSQEDAERTERAKSSSTDESVTDEKEMLNENWRVTYHKIEKILELKE